MNGERDLSRLLGSLDPKLHAERYSFIAIDEPALRDGQFALIREQEGLTSIEPDGSGEWARISLGVHSSLEAVGLTAVLSSQLADAGISANIVAGLFHDHLFVPWDRREEALAAICGYSLRRTVIARSVATRQSSLDCFRGNRFGLQ